jgi:hypothetical protein
MTQTEGLPILLAWLLFLAWLGVLAAIVLHGRDKTHHADTDRSPQHRTPAAGAGDSPAGPNPQG